MLKKREREERYLDAEGWGEGSWETRRRRGPRPGLGTFLPRIDQARRRTGLLDVAAAPPLLMIICT